MKLYKFPEKVSQIIKKVEQLDATVLITGESGTGKTLLAKWIHERSNRYDKKFVAINLATLSENLLESELFGHEKGAFSGADVKRIGRLEFANGGTVFLDEIGELTPRLQTKLLEFLQTRIITPVGGNIDKKLDVRIIVATNQKLEKLVAEGKFREDLFYRLNIFRIEMPSLMSNPERIKDLTNDFILDCNSLYGKNVKGLSSSLVTKLKEYSWPGNVRELKNSIEYAVAMCEKDEIDVSDLPEALQDKFETAECVVKAINKDFTHFGYDVDFEVAKSKFEEDYLREMLRLFSGRINLTSTRTGISKVTIINKIKHYGIDVNVFKLKQPLQAV